jgi:MoaA/NifB/PqqE/SkfB family radical SAM enzyme
MLDIKTCVLENNLDDLPLLYKEAMKLNAKFFSLTFIRKQNYRQNSVLWDDFSHEFNMDTYPIDLYFDMEHFKEIYKELESLQKNSKTQIRFSPRFRPTGDINKIERFFNAGNTPVTDLYKTCRIPMTSIYITPKGDVYPCLSLRVASLKEMSLKEAVNTVKFKCFRKNLHCANIFNACQMCCDAIPKNL